VDKEGNKCPLFCESEG